MRNKNIIMLLMSSLILSGCGPQPENKESQQQQPSTPTEQQVLAAQQAAIKEAEQSAAAAKALAQQEVQQYSDKQALQGRLQEAPTFARAAKAKATHIANPGTARYQQFDDNPVKQVAQNPLATFSLDVDTGSYANVRRFLNQGLLPPPDAVRYLLLCLICVFCCMLISCRKIAKVMSYQLLIWSFLSTLLVQ